MKQYEIVWHRFTFLDKSRPMSSPLNRGDLIRSITWTISAFVHSHLLESYCSNISEGVTLLSDWRKSGIGTFILGSGSIRPSTSLFACFITSSAKNWLTLSEDSAATQNNELMLCWNASVHSVSSKLEASNSTKDPMHAWVLVSFRVFPI